MDKYPKEFLMRVADKAEKEGDPSAKPYILCIDHLLEYDFEYLKKSGIIMQSEFYQAMKIVAEASKNYDYVKDVFDSIVEDVKRKGEYSEYFGYIKGLIPLLIEGDKDKYEEHILNKLFGDVWKDPDFFLPMKNFLGFSDRLPTLGDLLFRNTTFSDNISKELSKKIIKGLKLLYATIPDFMYDSFCYNGEVTFPDCSVTKYIKQDQELSQSCEMGNVIDVKILKNHIQIVKHIFLNIRKHKRRGPLFKKLTQQFSDFLSIFKRRGGTIYTFSLEKEERINLPTNFFYKGSRI